MKNLADIYSLLEEPLEELELMLQGSLCSEHTMLQERVSPLINMKGKRMRPVLTFLVAMMHGSVEKQHVVSGAIMELTHNASLVHDDVLDEAYTRRGELTTMAMMRSRGAVLAGDFLLTQGITLGIENGNYRAVDYMARTLRYLVEGELRQMRSASLGDVTFESYYDIIRLKTAHLMGACAALGAPQEHQQGWYDFGMLLGEAFQIMDDVLDYVSLESGKAQYQDLKEGKITLPLLYAMEGSGKDKKIRKQLLQGRWEMVAEFVRDHGGVERSRENIASRCEKAQEFLQNYPDTPPRRALMDFVDFLSLRNL